MKYTFTDFVAKANELHGNKYDYSKVVYVNSRTKVSIICPIHGTFEQLPSSHLSGNGCPKCARIYTDEHRQHLAESSRKSRGMTTEEWIARARQVHGDKYDYSQTIYINQRTNVNIICPVHGLFSQKADSHIRGFGCKLCGYETEVYKSVSHKWSDEQRVKTAATCLERYGTTRFLDSQEGKDKIAKIKSDPAFRERMSSIISSEEVQLKIHMTQKINHTVTTSQPEKDMGHLLVERFGENDVFPQHRTDERYPFACDFYIESLDLFIELNVNWTHGRHWFDETNADDLATLSIWKERAETSEFYRNAIHVWTNRDLLKLHTAVENNLNYAVFWNKNLSDFLEWFNSDELQLKVY